ncbi:hypothetical protein AMECASPLE_029701, partial [Ameca splendens]
EHRGRVSLVRTTALRLERLQLDDQGLYDCRILLLDNTADEVQSSNWTLLSVTGELRYTGLMFIKQSVLVIYQSESER